MATLRDFGLAPEEPEDRQPRNRRFVITDESGARPLPTDYREAYASDPLNEDVNLPGERRDRTGLLFGIGVGLGIALLALGGGLYFTGGIGGPTLAPGPEASTPEARMRPLDEMRNERALELARIAPVWISESSVRPAGTEQDSPDIRVVDETFSAQAPDARNEGMTPAAGTAEERSSDMTGEEQDAARGSEPAPSRNLSNELDELQRSLRPRGPVAPPRAPSNSQSAPPEPSLPPPAAPTAPAEVAPAENPY
jgi:hypothetical protein